MINFLRLFKPFGSLNAPLLLLLLTATFVITAPVSGQDTNDVSLPEGTEITTVVTETVAENENRSLSYGDATVLGVVEGLTEYLPVSSTGHLILTDELLNKHEADHPSSDAAKEAANAYLIIIQGGAILAVIFIYWRKLLRILMGLLGRDPEGLSLGLKVLVAFIPAAILGPLLDDMIESWLFNPQAVAVALAVGALVMIAVEIRRKKTVSPEEGNATASENDNATLQVLSYRGAILVGMMQCIAMWPGMSRSMVTIVGGYLVGLTAKQAAEFSFLLGLLTLTAASAYSLLGSWDVILDVIEPGPAIWGIVVATIVAFVAVKWFVGFLAKHGLIGFAIYRLLLAGIIWMVFR